MIVNAVIIRAPFRQATEIDMANYPSCSVTEQVCRHLVYWSPERVT